ncbi:wd-40 repeat protein [Stylonychia lemnae]|uniref:Wd-40 repeat protein n=1 Tax=Stylonychia lemnae TaxID=5949 RepID=A0A078A081_STYLE|nr:wd-40 repeat protein [Stylonychia lemnae]|eukprot:CDW75601.1 wd-40 repeat protein [Stylonychia lemnae]
MTENKWKNLVQQHSWLDFNNPQNFTCDNYFEDVSNEVPLTELYKIVDTCYANDNGQFITILLSVENEHLRVGYEGCKYVLQVWNKLKQRVYQQPLKERLKSWNSNNKYVIFAYKESADRQSTTALYNKQISYRHSREYVQIIFLLAQNQIVKVMNLEKTDELVAVEYFTKILYCCYKTYIKVFYLDFAWNEDPTQPVYIDAENPRTLQKIVPLKNYRILGMNDFFVFLETEDFQMTTIEIAVRQIQQKNPLNDQESIVVDLEIDLHSKRELLPRKDNKQIQFLDNVNNAQDDELIKTLKLDSITKYRVVWNKDLMFAMSLREKSGEVDLYCDFVKKATIKDRKIKDIALTFTSLFFLLEDETILYFDHNFDNNITINKARLYPNQNIEFQSIFIKTVQNQVKIFKGFNIQRTDKLTAEVYVSHDRFISVYDLNQKTWVVHFNYQHEIICQMLLQREIGSYIDIIILENSLVFQGLSGKRDQIYVEVGEDQKPAKLPSKVVCFTNDFNYTMTQYLVVDVSLPAQSPLFKLQCIVGSRIDYISMVPQNQKEFSVVKLLVKDQKKGNEKPQVRILIQTQEDLSLYLETIVYDKQTQNPSSVTLQLIKKFQSIRKEIKGKIHSGYVYDEKNNGFFIFDEENMYFVTNTNDQEKIITFQDVFCVGIQPYGQDEQFYALCQESKSSKNPGLRFFSIDQIREAKKCIMTLIKNIEVGTLGLIAWDESSQRMGMMVSQTSIIICPMLHRTVNRFQGVPTFESVDMVNMKDHKLFIVSQGKILTFDIYNGKKLDSYDLDAQSLGVDFKDYVRTINKKNLGKVLFVSKVQENDQNLYDQSQEFYKERELNIENLRTYKDREGLKTYKFIYAEIMSEKEVKIHMEFYFCTYQLDLKSKNEKPIYIHISDDMNTMICCFFNQRQFMYSRVQKTDRQIEWRRIKQFMKFPDILFQDRKFLEFFSPCLKRYIIFNNQNNQFQIKDNFNKEFELNIHRDILRPDSDETKLRQAINRIQWIDLNTMRILNEEGIEKIYKIDDVKKEFIPISYNKIPFYGRILDKELDSLENDQRYYEWHDHPYYKLRFYLQFEMQKQRLQVQYQNYVSSCRFSKDLSFYDIQKVLFNFDQDRIQYYQHSFTYISWSLIEQIQNGSLPVEMITQKQLETLTLNILPNGNTIFHVLSEKPHELVKLMRACHNETEIIHHMPMIYNYQKMTPMHLLDKNVDITTINDMLTHLSHYDLDHHSRELKDVVPQFLKYELPILLTYLDSRFKQTEQIKVLNRVVLKDDDKTIFPEVIGYRDEVFQQKILETDSDAKQHQSSLKFEYLDLPMIFQQGDPNFKEFYNELYYMSNYAFFKNRAITSIIEFNYQNVRTYLLSFLVIPFLMFHFLFVFYTNLVYEHRYERDYVNANWTMAIIILVFAFYFFIIEMIELIKLKSNYVNSVWNYFDLIAPSSVITVLVLQFLEIHEIEINQDFSRCILAIATFFMWIKILQIFRIFKSTGYLIRALIEVMDEMGIFLFILLLTLITFGDSFLRLSNGNPEDEQFIEHFFFATLFAYRMILGDFETTEFGQVGLPLVWIFFVMCTILVTIVMLNLLIAIISDAYSIVAVNSVAAMYQEMAYLIHENQYLVPIQAQLKHAHKDSYLVVISNLEGSTKRRVNPTVNKINQLEKKLLNQLTVLKNSNTKTIENQNKINAEIYDIKSSLHQLLKIQAQQNKHHSDEIQKTQILFHKHGYRKILYKDLKAMNLVFLRGCCQKFPSLKGCQLPQQDEQSLYRTDSNETLFHCYKCSFDVCQKCYKLNFGPHYHSLTEVTLRQIQKLNGYQDGWQCDMRYYKGCIRKDAKPFDDNEQVYLDDACKVVYCHECIFQYGV